MGPPPATGLPALTILVYGALVGLLTVMSRHEASAAAPQQAGRAARGSLMLLMTPLYVAPAFVFPDRLPLILPCVLLLALWVLAPFRGGRVELSVKRGVFTLVLFDGVICLGAGSPGFAATCALLYAGILGFARLIAQRGS